MLAVCAARVYAQQYLCARVRVCVSTRARTQSPGFMWTLQDRNRVGGPDCACLCVDLCPFSFQSKPPSTMYASTKGQSTHVPPAPPGPYSQSP